MKLLSIFAVILSCAFVFGDDDKCLDNVKDFLTCAKSQISETERDSIKDTVKSGRDKCFTDVGCTNNANFTLPPGLSAQLAAIPEPVKQCLKQKFLEKIGAKLNDCLTKKGVKNINVTEIASSLQAHEGQLGLGKHKEELHEAFGTKIAVAKGLYACCKEKFGGDTTKVQPLEQCLHNNTRSIKPKICTDLKPCIAKLSANCEKRGQEVHKAVCECKKEKEGEIAGKLAILGKQDKVSIKDLVHTVLDDQEITDAIKQVDACYTENNEPEPPILQLAIQAIANGGGKGVTNSPVSLQIDGKEATILSDSLQLDANDASECEPCQ